MDFSREGAFYVTKHLEQARRCAAQRLGLVRDAHPDCADGVAVLVYDVADADAKKAYPLEGDEWKAHVKRCRRCASLYALRDSGISEGLNRQETEEYHRFMEDKCMIEGDVVKLDSDGRVHDDPVPNFYEHDGKSVRMHQVALLPHGVTRMLKLRGVVFFQS